MQQKLIVFKERGKVKTPTNDNAYDWATSFIEHVEANPSIPTDHNTMTGWFANAICCAWDRKEERDRAKVF